MADQGETLLKLARGERGAIVISRVFELGKERVRLHELYPDPITGEAKSTRGFHFKLDELAAVGALFTATARNLEAVAERARAAEKKPDPPPPSAAPVELLPKAAGRFLGTREIARRGGACVVCGDPVEPGETYLWSDARRVGAHIRCGELAPRAEAPKRPPGASAPKQRELPGTRRQPQDQGVGAVSDEERRLAEEVF